MESFRFGFGFPHIQMMAARISKKVLQVPSMNRRRHRHRGGGGSKRLPVVVVRTVTVTVMKKYTANTFSLQLKNGFDVLESV